MIIKNNGESVTKTQQYNSCKHIPVQLVQKTQVQLVQKHTSTTRTKTSTTRFAWSLTLFRKTPAKVNGTNHEDVQRTSSTPLQTQVSINLCRNAEVNIYTLLKILRQIWKIFHSHLQKSSFALDLYSKCIPVCSHSCEMEHIFRTLEIKLFKSPPYWF